MIIAARVAIGRYSSKGVRKRRVSQTIVHVTTEVSHVVAQALRFTAVLEKLQATPYPPNRLDDIFASHCPISSLFGDNGFFVVYETNFATEIDSVNPISPITREKSHILNTS